MSPSCINWKGNFLMWKEEKNISQCELKFVEVGGVKEEELWSSQKQKYK